MTVLDEQQTDFLAEHLLAILATGRTDGSPQQSMVGYVVDDEGRIVISAKSFTAKWHNSVRQPSVSLCVPDGRIHLVVYGTAEAISEDPLRAELTADLFARMTGKERSDPSSIVPMLNEQRRTVIRITPTSAIFHE